MTKESPKFKETVEKAMHQFKSGKLKRGINGKAVKDRKQAIAIALSEARKNGE